VSVQSIRTDASKRTKLATDVLYRLSHSFHSSLSLNSVLKVDSGALVANRSVVLTSDATGKSVRDLLPTSPSSPLLLGISASRRRALTAIFLVSSSPVQMPEVKTKQA